VPEVARRLHLPRLLRVRLARAGAAEEGVVIAHDILYGWRQTCAFAVNGRHDFVYDGDGPFVVDTVVWGAFTRRATVPVDYVAMLSVFAGGARDPARPFPPGAALLGRPKDYSDAVMEATLPDPFVLTAGDRVLVEFAVREIPWWRRAWRWLRGGRPQPHIMLHGLRRLDENDPAVLAARARGAR
jgi:hypothetical protein